MSKNQISIYQRLSLPKKVQEEKKKISYWLEKLHSQGHHVGKDDSYENKSAYSETEKTKSPETKGREQHTKEQTLKKANDQQKVDELVRKSNRSIITVSSTFPWNLFPNTIDVEESRVTFIFRQFLTSQSHSVDIKDISNVFIESGIFFATLQVVSRTFVQNDIKIHYLNKKQAVKVKSVIEGLRTFDNNSINTSNYDVDDLVDKLCELNITR